MAWSDLTQVVYEHFQAMQSGRAEKVQIVFWVVRSWDLIFSDKQSVWGHLPLCHRELSMPVKWSK